jgi:hypothetical protein
MRDFFYRGEINTRRMPRFSSCVAVGLLTISVAALGCGSDSQPAPSQPVSQTPDSPAPVPVPSYTISGIVFEHTASGRRPAAGVTLVVYSATADVVKSDANGRYSATVHGDIVNVEPVDSEGYMSPCSSGTSGFSINPSRQFDVNIVSKAVLATTGLPDSYPITSIFVSGTVVETTSGGPRPVAGALVSFGANIPLAYATTLSDTLGRYVLCTAPAGSGTDQLMPLSVTKDGYSAVNRLVLGGSDEYNVTMELVRNK